jgi:hypothetical protein
VRRMRTLLAGAERDLHEVRYVWKYDGVFVSSCTVNYKYCVGHSLSAIWALFARDFSETPSFSGFLKTGQKSSGGQQSTAGNATGNES